jgi:hypothetical protein
MGNRLKLRAGLAEFVIFLVYIVSKWRDCLRAHISAVLDEVMLA